MYNLQSFNKLYTKRNNAARTMTTSVYGQIRVDLGVARCNAPGEFCSGLQESKTL